MSSVSTFLDDPRVRPQDIAGRYVVSKSHPEVRGWVIGVKPPSTYFMNGPRILIASVRSKSCRRWEANATDLEFAQEPSSEPVEKEVEEAVCDAIRSRRDAGRKKYGTTMERTDLTPLQWLQHAQEESMDFSIYLEKLRRVLAEQEKELQRLRKENEDLRARVPVPLHRH